MADKNVQLHKKNDTTEKWYPKTNTDCIVTKGNFQVSGHVNLEDNKPLNDILGGIYYDINNLTSVYKIAGSTSDFPTSWLKSANEGKVYNYSGTEAYTTTANWIGGAGKEIQTGTNVVIVADGSTYKFDALASTFEVPTFSGRDAGLVPSATSADSGKFLKSNGIWTTVSSLALGETSSTAYRGDRGKTAYDHSQSTHAPTTSKTAASGGTDLSLVTTGEKYTWNNKSSLTLGTTSSTAFRGDYGNTAYTHSQSTHAPTTSKSAANEGTDLSLVTTGEKYTWNNHTHTTSLASDSGTVNINLSANTAYKLTAGGTSVIFKTPADSDYKVQQNEISNNNNVNYEVLLSYDSYSESVPYVTDIVRRNQYLTYNPSTFTLGVRNIMPTTTGTYKIGDIGNGSTTINAFSSVTALSFYGNSIKPFGSVGGFNIFRNSTNTTPSIFVKGSNGYVGILNSNPSVALDVTGDIYATGGVTALSGSSSDARLKDNIKPFNAKGIIDRLNPVSFTWNDTAKELCDSFADGVNYGLIAQEADGVMDGLVFDMPNGYKGVKYEKLIPILLKAIKEQQIEINELKQKINL